MKTICWQPWSARFKPDSIHFKKIVIIVLLFTHSGDDTRSVADICGAERIVLRVVDFAVLDADSLLIARLLLDDLFPQQYTQILYVDGDTQVRGDLSPLIRADVPDEQFLACNDPLAFTLKYDTSRGRANRAHLLPLHGAPKPWLGSFPPWGDAAYEPYLRLMRAYPAYAPTNSAPRQPKGKVRWAAELSARPGTGLWGFGSRRSSILSYEAGLAPLPG